MRYVHVGGIGITLLLAFSAFTGCKPTETTAQNPADQATSVKKEKERETMTRISKSGYDVTPLPKSEVEALASKLDPEAYSITQQAGTERPFCGGLLDNKKDGVYACVVCDLPLFSSEHKFNSGTGWPSFHTEFDPQHVTRKSDFAYGMVRTEINCARCGAHLGHVFDDGPKPTGERHCLNSASLKFYDKGTEPRPQTPIPSGEGRSEGKTDSTQLGKGKNMSATETAYFAGGCFWGLEHYFQLGPGVIESVSGYMQGSVDNPTYKQVCGETTGHAETVKVVFDPSKITYRRLLEAFFEMHDPTQLNRQGPDYGDQYRSGIWYANDEQKKQAEKYISELTAAKKFGGRPIVTQVEAAKTFYPAEDYHQDYIEKTGRACHVHNPW